MFIGLSRMDAKNPPIFWSATDFRLDNVRQDERRHYDNITESLEPQWNKNLMYETRSFNVFLCNVICFQNEGIKEVIRTEIVDCHRTWIPEG